MSPIRELHPEMIRIIEGYKNKLRSAGVSRPTNKDASRLLSLDFNRLIIQKNVKKKL
jgi:hypothetical protein